MLTPTINIGTWWWYNVGVSKINRSLTIDKNKTSPVVLNNTANIAANTANIAANTANIAANTANIAANTANKDDINNPYKSWIKQAYPTVLLLTGLNKAVYKSIQDVWVTDINDTTNWVSDEWELFIGAIGINTNNINTATKVSLSLFFADKTYLATTGHFVQVVVDSNIKNLHTYIETTISTITGTVKVHLIINLSYLIPFALSGLVVGRYWWFNNGVGQLYRTFKIDKTKISSDIRESDYLVYLDSNFESRITLLETQVVSMSNLIERLWVLPNKYGTIRSKNVSIQSINLAIIDCWFSDVLDVSGNFYNPSWELMIGSVGFSASTLDNGKIADGTSGTINLYWVDQTGTTDVGHYVLFSIPFICTTKGLMKLSKNFSTITGTVTINILLDCTKFDLTTFSVVSGVNYILNIGVALAERYYSIFKKENTTFFLNKDGIKQDESLNALNFISPTKIYTTCNDIEIWTENLKSNSLNIYVERLIKLNSKIYCKFSSSNSIIKNVSSRRFNHVEYALAGLPNSDYANFNEDRHTINYNDLIIGDKIISSPISFSHISSKSSLSRNKFIPILQIGDSVTEGAGSYSNSQTGFPKQSWAYLKYYFDKDNIIDNGNRNIKMIGSRTTSNYILNGNTINCFAEGYSGWTALNFLKTKTFVDTNRFYDVDKIYSNSDLAAYGVKFSLQKYINRYRTLDDNGNRLYYNNSGATTGIGGNVGYIYNGTSYVLSTSIIGTEVVNTLAFDVCTPKVIFLQLGFNDGSTYTQDMQYLINAIKEEFPNMIIAISFIDASGCYYPELWDGWQGAEKDISFLEPMNSTNGYGYCKRLHDKMFDAYNSIKALENTVNSIYFINNNVIEPTANSVPRSDYSEPGLYGLKQYRPWANDAYAYHPSNEAHSIWGYHNYSFINFITDKII